MTLFAHLANAARAGGHNPAVILADALTGERTELSWATLFNWVSKGANLLIDELDIGQGDEVRLDLPTHWMAPVVCYAAWAVGAAVCVEGDGDARVGHESDGLGEFDLLIGGGMGGRLIEDDPDEALTVVDVLAQPDDFVDDPGDEGAWAIGGRTQASLLAEPIGGDRVLVHGDRIDEAMVVVTARTLAHGVGLVVARGYSGDELRRLADQERAVVLRRR